jgi:alpha-2-macroglobulin
MSMMQSLRRFATTLLGQWQWQAPSWIEWTRRQITKGQEFFAADRRRISALAAAVMIIGFAVVFYLNRPKPHYVVYGVTPPGLTEYNEKGISRIYPLRVSFNEPTAPLKQIEKRVTSGVEISPAIAGTWFWVNDKEIQFSPQSDWPVDGAFTVRFSKKDFLASGVLLERYKFDFNSQPFTARISESQFYQDPRDPNLKKLVATVQFSHPVDAEQLESRISFSVTKEAEYLGLKPDSRNFTLSYDKFRREAYIHSAALGMPRDDTPMTLRIEKGLRAARGGNETTGRLESVVTIPGRTSLKFANARMTLVDNARYEPEQILMMTSSSPVAERALAGKVAAYVLPVRHPKQPPEDKNPYHWDAPDQIGNEIVKLSQPLTLTYVASDSGSDTTHGFKFLAPVGRYLYFVVNDGIQGTGGYISGKPFVGTIEVQPYRQALTFLGQGALLSMSGDKKVGFLVRDVDKVEIEVGRVLPNQMQHLAQQMFDFSRPSFYGELEDRLVERFTMTRDYRGHAPGKPIYDNVDLTQYFQDKTQARRGLFMLHVRSIESDQQSDEEQFNRRRFGLQFSRIEDMRLILITDLGFVVKHAKNGTRDVFVQSIRTGEPVEGTRVEVIGQNGQPILAATTDRGGRAQLPKTEDIQFRREKAPLMILAEKGDDFSFMPFRTNGRGLDLSRFDTGGAENADSPQQLSSYLFTDRGIYRPGETTHLGVITRTADWKSSLTGLPLEVEVSDAGGMIVSRNSLKLSATAFDEISYTSQPASPTGTYQATAYLIKDDKRREVLGSTSFKVQEFEPDRMKVRLDLSDKLVEGWLTPDDVKARVTAAHLFGEPASNRRIEGEMSLTPALPRFARYPDYRFQIGEFLPEPFHETLQPTITDDKGNAELKLDLRRFVGRAYRLNVLARAFEAEGGRNVAAQNNAIVSDAPYLVGIKADGDLNFVRRTSPHQAHWIAVNQQLTPVAADNLTLEWVQHKFVSVLTQQPDQTYKYVSRLKEIVRDTKSVKIAVGGTNFALPTQEPGDFVLVLRNSAGAELNRLNYSVAGQANISRSLERNAELQIQLDKPAYSGGDTIEVSIRAPYVGAGLITIERDRVLHYQWFKSTTTSSVQRISLPRDFEGNGYVSVQFLRDPASDELFMSPLSYGIAPFAANLSARAETVTLTAPRETKPGTTITMHLKPSEASKVAVLAVDEGILQVARYKNPDPLGYFFQKRMLEVDTRQILDLILPDFKRFVALAAAGGDADGGFSRHLNPFNRKHKPPVAYWSGLVDVTPAGRDFRYAVPDYFNGKLRIVAIAVNAGRIGVADSATEVKGDLILTPNVPAMVAPGDEFVVSVGVFNNTVGNSQPIQVEVQPDAELSTQGTARVELQVADKKEGVAEFRLKANGILGPASLKFVARRAGAEARMEESISVRPANAYRTQLTLGRLDSSSAIAPLTRDLYSEHRNVEGAISAIPLVWGRGLIAYLDEYEYSCTEQLVSRGMAALVVISRPEMGTVKSRDPQNLTNTFSVLQSRENAQGGFGLWASSPDTAEFATVYAAHFLIEAKERNQKIPAEMLAGVNDWLTRFASTPASSLEAGRLRAYAVYLLVRQGIKPNAAIANVEQELSRRYTQAWPTDLAAAYLAATYRLMQRNNDADRIIRNVPWANQKKDWGEEVYYDPLVHDAQLLYLLARHFPNQLGNSPPPAMEAMSSAISGNRGASLSSAYMLLALDAYAKATATTLKLGISEIAKDGKERVLTLPAGSMPKVPISQNAAKIQFTKDGPMLAYYVVNESGFDRNAPVADVNQGIEIIREFVDLKGDPMSKPKIGEEFLVRLRLRATKRDRLFQVAVVDLLPGGVEPVLELQPPADTANAGIDPAVARGQASFGRLPIGLPDKSTWHPYHVDVRDDRVVLYGDATKDASAFVYRVRATNAGVFQTPPAFAEGMYNRTITGLSPAGKLEIVKP